MTTKPGENPAAEIQISLHSTSQYDFTDVQAHLLKFENGAAKG